MPRGRPRTLDSTAKAEIIALISAGASRTQASEYVGCCLATIYNEARRDEAFERDLRRAQVRPVIWHLQNIQKQADKSWRASAWLLERCYPHQYGRRVPDSVSRDEVNSAVALMLDVIHRELGPAAERRIARHFNRISARVQRWSADHGRPFERNDQPRATDRFEAETQPRDSTRCDAPSAAESTSADEPPRARRRRGHKPRSARWCVKHGVPYRERRADGTYYTYDPKRLREAVEFARPKPNPLSADWLDHCERQRRRAERRAMRWAQRARRGVYDLKGADATEQNTGEQSTTARLASDRETSDQHARGAASESGFAGARLHEPNVDPRDVNTRVIDVSFTSESPPASGRAGENENRPPPEAGQPP